MFTSAEIVEMRRPRDAEGNITEVIATIRIADDVYGETLAVFYLHGEALAAILAIADKSAQATAYMEWVKPHLRDTYDTWVGQRKIQMSEKLTGQEVAEGFGTNMLTEL
jgi:hypothetical protein